MLEINFEPALARAKELDQFYEKNGRPIGPLHGLPYTTKDQFHMKGLDTTMAYIGWIGTQGGCPRQSDKEDLESNLISELDDSGAVAIGKVLYPQNYSVSSQSLTCNRRVTCKVSGLVLIQKVRRVVQG